MVPSGPPALFLFSLCIARAISSISGGLSGVARGLMMIAEVWYAVGPCSVRPQWTSDRYSAAASALLERGICTPSLVRRWKGVGWNPFLSQRSPAHLPRDCASLPTELRMKFLLSCFFAFSEVFG